MITANFIIYRLTWPIGKLYKRVFCLINNNYNIINLKNLKTE